jgi:hypothetical protein
LASLQDLDAAGLESHLRGLGHDGTLDLLLGPRVFAHVAWAAREVSLETALQRWEEAFARFRGREIEAEIQEVKERLGKNLSPKSFPQQTNEYLKALKLQEHASMRSGTVPHQPGKGAGKEA